MKAALLDRSLEVTISEMPTPEMKADEVLVNVRACGVCATDVKKFAGISSTPFFPFILGHEPAGVVADIGAGVRSELKPGDRVAIAPVVVCGYCHGCMSGLVAREGMGMCENYQVLGYSTNGAFAEFIAVPAQNVFKIPDNLSFRDAALIEPVAACANGVFKALTQPPGKALVLGAGFMGLASMALLKLLGAEVLVTDIMQERLEAARMMGADVTVNGKDQDISMAVKDFTHGRGADSVICAVGNKALTEAGINMLGKAGRIVLLASGEKNARVEIDLNNTHYFHPVITGSVSYTNEQFLWTMEVLANRRIPTDLLVTHTGGLEDTKRFMEMTRDLEGLKKVILMGGDKNE